MTFPDLCCAEGGAMTFWLRIISCMYHGGVMTTVDTDSVSGFRIFCFQFNDSHVGIRYVLFFGSALYCSTVHMTAGSGWFHVKLNFLGLNDGQGIRIHHNWNLVGSQYSKHLRSVQTCSSIGPRIIVIKCSSDPDISFQLKLSTQFTLMNSSFSILP